MSAFSDYLENVLLNQTLNGDAPASALDGDLFIALFTADPGDDDSGTEVSGNGYARAAMDSSSSNKWTVSGGQAYNTAAVVFPIASGGDWGTITHVGIYDASSGGNLLYHFPLIQSTAVTNGETFQFPPAALAVRLL